MKLQTQKNLFLIIGAPGSGKTTDAGVIAQESEKIVHYSTGELLRTEAQSGSPLGMQIAEIINEGKIVPVAVALDAILNVIKNTKEEIILIDGYPRSEEQMLGLNALLKKENKIVLKGLIDLVVSDETAKKRVLGRNRGVDDDIKVFEKRLKVYYEPKEAIEKFYKQKNLLHVINAEQEIDAVVKDMKELLKKLL